MEEERKGKQARKKKKYHSLDKNRGLGRKSSKEKILNSNKKY